MAIDTQRAADGEHTSEIVTGLLRFRSGKQFRRALENQFKAQLAEIVRQRVDLIAELPYARWLLDNSHIVREALQQIETDLPANYYRQLTKPPTQDILGQPRIFSLVDRAVAESGLPIDVDSVEESLRKQTTHDHDGTIAPLTLGELWAVPIALRILLLSRLCKTLRMSSADCLAAGSEDDVEHKTTIVAGCIISLRSVATTDWRRFVERSSVVEQQLRSDPDDVYGRMDLETRDYYRGAVEVLAERSNVDQETVARTAVHLAAQVDSAAGIERHVGYYLFDEGRPQLEALIAYRPGWNEKLRRAARRFNAALYLAAILGLTAAGNLGLFFALLAHDTHPIASFGAALLASVPLLHVAVVAVNLLVNRLTTPRRLPKLDFAAGIPADQRALIVVPMMLSGGRDIAANLAALEQNYLANAEPSLRFALLSDYCDAATAETELDAVLLNQAIEGIDKLNERYGEGGSGPFYLFHRRRLWNENAGQWMGWERKRGKLEEFNALLRGASDTSYVLQHGAPFAMDEVRYVITLDADSYMPPDTAIRLIGAHSHPLNRPRFEDTDGIRIKGYTIIQPRLEANPVSGTDTLFTRIFAGDTLLDLYTHAVSDVYQDLFGDAVFTGKGIYDVDAFTRSVDQRIKPNSILSHDLLEGLFGHVALASDIVVLEDYPPNYLAYLKRSHRWIRGDWQLLPWLFRRTTSGHDFRPGLIGRWKIFDNLRRSLMMPTLLLMLLGGWAWLAENAVLWTAVFALFPGLPILLRVGMVLRTSSWRWGTVQSSLRNLGGQAGADAARWGLALAFLPVEAYAAVDATIRTLYRLFVSQRRLLEWSTAATVARTVGAASSSLRFWRGMWAGPAAAVLTGAG
ncbi:MAG TPA: hypothetical protein PKK10_16975, partial [Woeseiaceae bacterium]|nr:hypothetical protein [Woeseiaceae bacterium]